MCALTTPVDGWTGHWKDVYKPPDCLQVSYSLLEDLSWPHFERILNIQFSGFSRYSYQLIQHQACAWKKRLIFRRRYSIQYILQFVLCMEFQYCFCKGKNHLLLNTMPVSDMTESEWKRIQVSEMSLRHAGVNNKEMKI